MKLTRRTTFLQQNANFFLSLKTCNDIIFQVTLEAVDLYPKPKVFVQPESSPFRFCLQTRITDWREGALTTRYLLGRLQDAELQLQQYESSAAPPGWACHWDRYALFSLSLQPKDTAMPG